MNKLFFIIFLLLYNTASKAKELQLIIQNQVSSYPMSIHYKFSNANKIYAEGNIHHIKINEKYFVYVNKVQNDKKVLVQIDKMVIKNVIVFNDPCEIYLSEKKLTANIIVGFKGDPNPEKHNGSFTCYVSTKM